jgi:polysaccharide export outer membrane protein
MLKIKGFGWMAFFSLVLVSQLAAQTGTPTSPLPNMPQPDLAPLPESVSHPDITQSADPGYILKPNDYVQIVVFQEDDLTTSTRISPQGNVTLPLIGTVKVGGSTVANSVALIRKMLMDGYIRDPQVAIHIIEFAKRRFSVLGEVQKPGSFEMPQQEQVTLLDAIALAGGYTPVGNATAVGVRRNVNGKDEIFTLNAKEMAEDPAHQPYYLQPGDVVTVIPASQSFFSVLGQVQKPGSIQIPPQTQVTILDAIAQAGGYTDLGDPTCVSVRRTLNGVETIDTINAKQMAQEPAHKPYYILPGDVVTVIPASRLYFSVLGQVQKPGSFEVPPQTQVTILDAIAQAGGYTNIADPGRVNVRRTINGKESIFIVNAKKMAINSSQQFFVQPGDVITVAESLF